MISIIQQPAVFSPGYNDMVFVASSDNILQPQFSYIVDIYFEGQLQTRHRIQPRPDNGLLVFNATAVIEGQITQDIDINTTGFGQNVNSYIKYYIEFGEEYSVSGALTLTANLAQSENVYAINAALDFQDFVNWNYPDRSIGLSVNDTELMVNGNLALSTGGWYGYTSNTLLTGLTNPLPVDSAKPGSRTGTLVVGSYYQITADYEGVSNGGTNVQMHGGEALGGGEWLFVEPGVQTVVIKATNNKIGFEEVGGTGATITNLSIKNMPVGKLLTNAPYFKLTNSFNGWIYYLSASSSYDFISLKIDSYDSSNNFISSQVVSNPYTDLSVDDNKFARFNFSTYLTADHIIIYPVDSNGNNLCQPFTIYNDTACSKYDNVRLHFLNALGGFDPVDFRRLSQKTATIERTTYKRNLGSVSGTSWVYNPMERAIVQEYTKTTDSISLNSDWVDESQYEWLKELFTSPVVYQELNGKLIAVNVTPTSWTEQKKQNTRIFNVSIQLEYSVENYRQRY